MPGPVPAALEPNSKRVPCLHIGSGHISPPCAQSYLHLLKAYQLEARILVRQALDVLIPVLPSRLAEVLKTEAVKRLQEAGEDYNEAEVDEEVAQNVLVWIKYFKKV
jgi:hypothetical protein